MGLLVAEEHEGLRSVAGRCLPGNRPAWIAPGLLAILSRQVPEVVSRRVMTLAVWGEADALGPNTADVNMGGIRAELSYGATKIEPVRARGCRFVAT
jgi:DNA-binding response OmpR family regulator